MSRIVEWVEFPDECVFPEIVAGLVIPYSAMTTLTFRLFFHDFVGDKYLVGGTDTSSSVFFCY